MLYWTSGRLFWRLDLMGLYWILDCLLGTLGYWLVASGFLGHQEFLGSGSSNWNWFRKGFPTIPLFNFCAHLLHCFVFYRLLHLAPLVTLLFLLMPSTSGDAFICSSSLLMRCFVVCRRLLSVICYLLLCSYHSSVLGIDAAMIRLGGVRLWFFLCRY